jgi:hypothetical protein
MRYSCSDWGKIVEGLYEINKEKAEARRVILQNGKPVPINDTLNLFKYYGTQYYGIIPIGKPGRDFKMVKTMPEGTVGYPLKIANYPNCLVFGKTSMTTLIYLLIRRMEHF